MNFIIPLHIYPHDVMISIGQTDEELNKCIKKWGGWIEPKDLEPYHNESVRARYYLNTNCQAVIRLKSMPKEPYEFGNLQHEICHVVCAIMEDLGMELKTMVSDEAYAYLTGYLTTEIYKRLCKCG